MAEEPEGLSQVSTGRHRRPNQDYCACNSFLPAEMWRKLGSDRSERTKAEELAEFLFSHLGLRLPTEPTYATMTALVCSSASPSRFELHSALQTVKSSWRSLSNRMLKISKEDKKAELLQCLPARWEDLPERLRSLWGDVRPAGRQEASVSQTGGQSSVARDGWSNCCEESTAAVAPDVTTCGSHYANQIAVQARRWFAEELENIWFPWQKGWCSAFFGDWDSICCREQLDVQVISGGSDGGKHCTTP